jgi:hypothetical protein
MKNQISGLDCYTEIAKLTSIEEIKKFMSENSVVNDVKKKMEQGKLQVMDLKNKQEKSVFNEGTEQILVTLAQPTYVVTNEKPDQKKIRKAIKKKKVDQKPKEVLPMTFKSYAEVNSSDLERFAEKVYGLKDYSFVAVQECGNDSQHTFDIDGKIDGYDSLDAADIRSGKCVRAYRNRLLLNCLCADGHIPKAEYIVEVCW